MPSADRQRVVFRDSYFILKKKLKLPRHQKLLNPTHTLLTFLWYENVTLAYKIQVEGKQDIKLQTCVALSWMFQVKPGSERLS